ncbi:hypothetical protein PPERSA_00441 [Pseudocohnilembus persalinus]|uniref:Uncharacterized protein n=1 Tax=Pseudocohnilembus persalinus TaxID=266149 RepID=A0A0V0QHS6_PSEPJ|nr:hypothetical protein PPERSA_00441 [Pseudocohnilembus persalinus]|eukprot:KRX01674.1 hypothetical protein PPERSA_00441 [Pseudocohnilembus persalinus]
MYQIIQNLSNRGFHSKRESIQKNGQSQQNGSTNSDYHRIFNKKGQQKLQPYTQGQQLNQQLNKNSSQGNFQKKQPEALDSLGLGPLPYQNSNKQQMNNNFTNLINSNLQEKNYDKEVKGKSAREQLQEEVLEMKLKYNKLNDKLVQTISQKSHLEKENRKMNKVFENVDSYIALQKGSKNLQTNDTSLVLNYKKQIREFKDKVQQLEKQLEEEKKSNVRTKIQEIKIENDHLLKQNIKLKNQYEHVLQDMELRGKNKELEISEEKYYLQNSIINSLQLDKKNLEQDNIILENKVQELEVQQQIFEKQKSSMQQEDQQLKQKVQNLELQVQQYQNQNKELFQEVEMFKNQKIEQFQQEQLKINEQQQERIEEQQSQIQNLQQINQDFKERLEEKIAWFNSEMLSKDEEIENLEEQNSNLQEQVQELEITIQMLRNGQQNQMQSKSGLIQNESPNKKYEFPIINIQEQQQIQSQLNDTSRSELNNNNNNQTPSDGKRQSKILMAVNNKQFRTVITEDVKLIGVKLNYQLRKHRLDVNEVIDQPFCIEDEQEALLISRYLVEDNDIDYVQIDINNQANLTLVRSRFKYIVQEVKNYQPEQEKEFEQTLIPILKEYRIGLEGQLQLHGEVKQKKIVRKQIINEAVQYLEIPLSEKLKDYWFYTLFLETNKVDEFPYDLVLYTYDKEQLQKLKERENV